MTGVDRERLIEAAAELVREPCREELGAEGNWEKCNEPAEFVLWGKLLPKEALGPRCYDHAAKHMGHRSLAPSENYALMDLRPVQRVLAVLPAEPEQKQPMRRSKLCAHGWERERAEPVRATDPEDDQARDRIRAASYLWTPRENRVWDRAWDAARKFYAEPVRATDPAVEAVATVLRRTDIALHADDEALRRIAGECARAALAADREAET